MYDREKQKLKSVFNGLKSRICLTSDVWTAINNKGYICLTAHFVDSSWKLNSKVINFCQFPPPHNGINLANIVMRFLNEWVIEKKVFSLTLDNASANNSMVTLLKEKLNINSWLLSNGNYFHVRCCAPILNLIVQDGLKVANDALHQIRQSVGHVRVSEARMR